MTYYPPRYLFRRHELLKRAAGGNHFLEIGPGSLLLAVELLGVFRRGTLIDFSEDARAAYEALAPADRDRLVLVIADFVNHHFEEPFDAVIACEVLEHIRDEALFLDRVRGLLNPGGQLILSVPARKRLWSDHDQIAGHLRRYERQEVEDLVLSRAFRNVSVIAYGFPFINALRWVRIVQAKLQYKDKAGWSQEQQTQKSGVAYQGQFARVIGRLVNPVTAHPLCRFSALFNNRDWSEGYLVIGQR
jgi:SAM-dependent methyltransferase